MATKVASDGRSTSKRRRGRGEGAVFQRDDGRWVGSVDLGWVGGRRRRKVVYGRTRADVVEKIRKLHNDSDRGVDLAAESLTVTQLLERWLSDVVPGRVSAATLSNYDTVARKHIMPAIGKKKLAKLTPMDVQSLLREKETHRLPRKDGKGTDGGYSARTVRLIRTVLVMAIGQAERWGMVGRNVAALTDGPRIPHREGRTLTVDEAKKLLETARGDRLEACYITLLALGLRRGEVLGLSWSDVDVEKGLLRVRRGLKRENGQLLLGNLKTASSRRTLNLPEQVTDALRTHKAKQAAERLVAGPDWRDSGLVFTTPLGTAVDPDNFRHRFSRLTTKAGLGHWHPHELRHSAASLMLAAGVPLEVVSNVLGHASIRITADVYGHIMEPQRQAAAEAMGRVLWSDGS